MLRTLPLSLFVFLVVPIVSAADWPQFRGPTGNGHATAKNLPTTWDETINVAWKSEIPGKGWSSPSLFQNRLYLTTAVPAGPAANPEDEQSLRALCVDANSGRILWDVEVFKPNTNDVGIHTKNSHASPTPLVDGGRVYVHFGHYGVACLDLTGNAIWKDTTHGYEPVHGNGGSPILVQGLLIFSCDGGDDPFVVALDASNGQERWRFARSSDSQNKFSFSTPAVITVNGRQQLITPGSGVVNALDPATGREIWRATYGNGYSVIPKPVYGQGLLYVATGYNTPTVMAIRPDGMGDVTDTHVAWTNKKSAPHTPSLLLVGDELYMVSDKAAILTCLDAKTGEELWHERIGGNYSASPLFADGKIYIQSEEGLAIVFKPGKTFTRLADTGFHQRTLASYAVGESCLFIRTEKNLYRVQQK